MARVTVEDCLNFVENRFQLVILAAKRARQLMRGSVEPTVPWENDKATVVALREIATGHTDFSDAHVPDMNIDLPPQTTIQEEIIIIEEEESDEDRQPEFPDQQNNPESHEASATDHPDVE